MDVNGRYVVLKEIAERLRKLFNICVVAGEALADATVLGFRNGRARVKGYNGKWVVIDTSGNLIEPCDKE